MQNWMEVCSEMADIIAVMPLGTGTSETSSEQSKYHKYILPAFWCLPEFSFGVSTN